VRLLTAGDGAAAHLAGATDPDLVRADGAAGAGDGLTVCRALRARGGTPPEVPLVLLVEEPPDAAAPATGVAAGATDFLARPFTPATVRALVRRWLLRQQPGAAGPDTRDGGIGGPPAGSRTTGSWGRRARGGAGALDGTAPGGRGRG
jgi:two-component system OmpR family response regulator